MPDFMLEIDETVKRRVWYVVNNVPDVSAAYAQIMSATQPKIQKRDTGYVRVVDRRIVQTKELGGNKP